MGKSNQHKQGTINLYELIGILLSFIAIIISSLSIYLDFSDRTEKNKLISDKEAILSIINLEAEATVHRAFDKILTKFTDDAIIKDVGSDLTNQFQGIHEPVTWVGKEKIMERYNSLPEFKYLKHIGIVVTIDESRNYAQALAGTNGEYKDRSGKYTEISSVTGERWTFEKRNGNWFITSFCYNVP